MICLATVARYIRIARRGGDAGRGDTDDGLADSDPARDDRGHPVPAADYDLPRIGHSGSEQSMQLPDGKILLVGRGRTGSNDLSVTRINQDGAPDYSFGTDTGVNVADLGVQVHGGMGFIEETGAAQFSRDVRATAIYEGTNGIQSMDLVARKMMDGGRAAYALLDEIAAHAALANAQLPDLAESLATACEALRSSVDWLVEKPVLNDRFAGSVSFLKAFARVLGGHYHLKAALVTPDQGSNCKLARFYMNALLGEYIGLLQQARQGAADLYALSFEELTA